MRPSISTALASIADAMSRGVALAERAVVALEVIADRDAAEAETEGLVTIQTAGRLPGSPAVSTLRKLIASLPEHQRPASLPCASPTRPGQPQRRRWYWPDAASFWAWLESVSDAPAPRKTPSRPRRVVANEEAVTDFGAVAKRAMAAAGKRA